MNKDPLFNRAKVEEWRTKAAQARDAAIAAPDNGLRRTLDEIAEHWDRLAEEIETICDVLDE